MSKTGSTRSGRRGDSGTGSRLVPNPGEERKISVSRSRRLRRAGQLDAGPFAADIASFRCTWRPRTRLRERSGSTPASRAGSPPRTCSPRRVRPDRGRWARRTSGGGWSGCSAGRRELGGALFAAAGAWCAGVVPGIRPAAAAGLSAVYVAAMGGSHPLAKRIGAWPAVGVVTAVTVAAAELVTRTVAR